MSIFVQKLKNIDQKTLVIFQPLQIPQEKHACFIPRRGHSIGRFRPPPWLHPVIGQFTCSYHSSYSYWSVLVCNTTSMSHSDRCSLFFLYYLPFAHFIFSRSIVFLWNLPRIVGVLGRGPRWMVIAYSKLDARYAEKDPTVMTIVCAEVFIMGPLCILWWVIPCL